jgi:predicted nucleotidyltransferase
LLSCPKANGLLHCWHETLLDNLPASLGRQRECLASCLEVMNSVMPLRAVYLFGSHAHGEARADSDVDSCIVADAPRNNSKR